MIVKKALLFMFLLSSFSIGAAQPTAMDQATIDAMNNQAKGINSTFATQYGSADGIQNNVARPLTSDQNMKSIDGKKDFETGLACRSEYEFMDLFVAPTNTGDLANAIFKFDTNGDGSKDKVSRLPGHISGVCGNGYISCTKGTWNNCTGYKWVGGTNGVSVQEVAKRKLGGCYCINSSCGSALAWRNLGTVMDNLAAGAASAAIEETPQVSINKVVTSDTTAKVYAELATACDGGGSPSVTSFNKSPNSLRGSGLAFAQADKTYKLVTTSSANNASSNTNRTCSVKRRIPINETSLPDIIDYESGEGTVFPCGKDCLRMVLGKVGDNYWSSGCGLFKHEVSFNILKPDRIKKATITRAIYDDWIGFYVNGSKAHAGPIDWTVGQPLPGGCELSTSWNQRPNKDFTSLLKSAGRKKFEIYVWVAGGGEGYGVADIQVDTSCWLEPQDDIIDTCQPYKNNQDCDLVEEEIDGVYTYRNHAPTGLSVLPSSKTISGSYCSFPVTRPWYEKRRMYSCKNTSKYNLDNAISRVAHIQDTATDNTFQDLRFGANGKSSITDMNLALYEGAEVSQCSMSCKVKTEVPNNDVSHSGVLADRLTDPRKFISKFKACTPDNVCPLEAGEQIDKNCACINQFGEAVGAMQAARMAGSDLICTGGAKP